MTKFFNRIRNWFGWILTPQHIREEANRLWELGEKVYDLVADQMELLAADVESFTTLLIDRIETDPDSSWPQLAGYADQVISRCQSSIMQMWRITGPVPKNVMQRRRFEDIDARLKICIVKLDDAFGPKAQADRAHRRSNRDRTTSGQARG